MLKVGKFHADNVGGQNFAIGSGAHLRPVLPGVGGMVERTA